MDEGTAVPLPMPDAADAPDNTAALAAARDAERGRSRRQDLDIRRLVSSNKALRRETQGLRVQSWRDEETIQALEAELIQTRRARDSANRRGRLLAHEVATLRSRRWFRLAWDRLAGGPGVPPPDRTKLARQPILAGDGPFFKRGFRLGGAAEISGTTVKRIKRAPSGMLIFGPYVQLPAGTYAVTLDARLYRRLPISTDCRLEIVCDGAQQFVGMRWLRLYGFARWHSFELVFTVWEGEDYPDFEVRLWVRRGTPLEIGRLDLYRLTEEPSPGSAGTADATGDRRVTVNAPSRAAALVSIALPVYNQACLVDEAIAGILSQTYPNWELIVLDDGSTDGLEQRVRHYLGDRRVMFLRQPNQKLPAALNHAFRYARGELLTWTSADNIMLPTQLERLVATLAAHPDAGLVYSDYWAIDDKGEPLDNPGWRSHNRDPEIADLIRLPSEVTIENFHRSGDNFIGASFLYRREVADIVGRYADDAFGGEDFDYWLRMHLVTGFRHVAEPLYKYRVHENTLSSRAGELGLLANIRELLEADRWRIDTLLSGRSAESALLSGASALRPLGQFHAALLRHCRPVAYRSLVERDPAATPGKSAVLDPVIIDIDVPAPAIDPSMLHDADILLCRSALTAALLRREDWAGDKRILIWDGEPTPALQHAFVQAFAERVSAPLTPPMRRTLPRIDDPFRPARILLLVDCWSSNGLDKIVVDLALGLAGNGRTVFVASARESPPPASPFADAAIRTLSFRGDEAAFEGFLRREAIEVVHYHDCVFAVGRASGSAVATVYTVHDLDLRPDLRMDDATRQQVRRGLDTMDRVIAVSPHVAEFAAAQFGVKCDRIAVVPGGRPGDSVSRQRMIDATLLAYTMACRGGGLPGRVTAPA